MTLAFTRCPPEPPDPWTDGLGTLIRSELFSIERLEQHAESLARAQRVSARPEARRSLITRLGDNERVLHLAYRGIAATSAEGAAITPAAEWLLDNYFVLEEQIRDVRKDLPVEFYRELPKLADGPLRGFPRVFGVAWASVAHSDSLFDPEMVGRFLRAYQRAVPLTIGELWAVATTLRIVLIENLRRAADRILGARLARREADALAERLLGRGLDGEAIEPHAVDAILAAIGDGPLSISFAAELVLRLRDQDPRAMPALRWLDERLRAQGTSAEDVVREEHQSQGAMNVTVRNIITSMRLISAVDWTEFFETVSPVDAEMRAGSGFAAMDFATRDLYRRAIERLARHSSYTEIEVAQRALAATRPAQTPGAQTPAAGIPTTREHDPGFVLIGEGRPAFERQLAVRVPWRERLVRAYGAMGIGGYLASIGGGTLLVAAAAALVAAMAASGGGVPQAAGSVSWPLLAGLFLVALAPGWELAATLVNRMITSQFTPTILPGLELRDGIPLDLRTLVAVPIMLTTVADAQEQVERLEVHHLANPDEDLRFALLSDWLDSKTETGAQTAEADAASLAAAAEGVARLNRRHGPTADGPRFLLFHRRRRWNAAEGVWMGWERKRGKLTELNRLLGGAEDTSFMTVAGVAPTAPPSVRYVLTLDADTRLPPGAAARLVGKMAHPLNLPVFDPDHRRVVKGHGVLQPRVTPSLPGDGEGSWFQRVFSSASGIDPYAFAISDVYQDLFGEGSFSGKGIYDVAAFEAALAGRVRENALLSHDLLEGIYARAGLTSDIEVVEDFPPRYDVAAARQHRWTRGDWQLWPWIAGSAGADMTAVGRWKMLDNLRRSLAAPAAVLGLAVGWTLPPAAAAVWSAFILATIVVPALLPVVEGLFRRQPGLSASSHAWGVAADASRAGQQALLLFAFLPHQAWLAGDAIVRTLFRLMVSRRDLLEWTTSAQASLGRRLDTLGFYRRMAGGVGLAVAAGLVTLLADSGAWPIALPPLVLWLLAPALARRASLATVLDGGEPLAPAGVTALRLVARRTWRYFETFVTADEHHLPPDNFQEEPRPAIAHRTSPTNIGLYLLSTVAARDFGWIGTQEMAERLRATLEAMAGMERHRGHFYNWYETSTRRPLEPRYVSSVDSGNLAGHLIALANACREAAERPTPSPGWARGVDDALALTRESLAALGSDLRPQTVTRGQLEEALEALAATLRAPIPSPIPSPVPADIAAELADTTRHLAAAADQASTVVDIVHTVVAELGARELGVADLASWAEAIRLTIHSHQRDAERPAQATRALVDELNALAERADAMVKEMEFGFLLDPARGLLSIGYNLAEGAVDTNAYDLLASEARLASFIAIAKGDVPPRHWFRLGRAVTPIGGESALVSWSGSMFEYLMPALVLREPAGSLLDRTSRLIVRRQIHYGRERGVPWGISESAYNARDLEFTYQYSNFGVPGLGLKRGLHEDVVVAPYATLLAAMFDAGAAIRNLERLTAAGGKGRYGFCEALDYTRRRLPDGDGVAVVRSYMAHHQGMSVVAIANTLCDGGMRRRFHAAPMVQATELLLQERAPRGAAVAHPRVEDAEAAVTIREQPMVSDRRFLTPHTPLPRTHLLSNEHYAVMVTAAGSGYSRWRDLAVTRWREDPTCDDWGSHIYLRDADSGAIWSAAHQPCRVEADRYEVNFREDRATILRQDGTLTTTLEIAVSPEHSAEVRRVSIANTGSRVREIDVTSYAEVVLTQQAADLAHPAFAKLFVETEYVEELAALLATRRPRSPDDPTVWAAHLAVVEGETVGAPQFETDRARFLGRGHGVARPLAVTDGRRLANGAGAVLDAVFSLRYRVRIPPGDTVRVAFWTLIAPSRAEALDLADKHRDPNAFERAGTRSWTQAQIQLQHLGIGADDAHLFQRLASRVLYSDPSLRPPSEILKRGGYAPSWLWPLGISGDLPIVLLRVGDADELRIVRQSLRAHEYWRTKRLAVDLVILDEQATTYFQNLQEALEALVRVNPGRPAENQIGGNVYIVRADIIAPETRALLNTVARVVLLGRRGSLAEQLAVPEINRDIKVHARFNPALPWSAPPWSSPVWPTSSWQIPPSQISSPSPPEEQARLAALRATLEFFNGLGGFANDGRDYVTILEHDQWTPAPWINVLANPSFGCHVSVEGGGATWSVNARENQLTPWSNDPVSDRSGDAIYLRDEETGALWTPTALPIRGDGGPFVATHGQGYSRFEHTAHAIAAEMLVFVPLDASVKVTRLTLRNRTARARRLSVTAYVEWVMGRSRSQTAPFIVTAMDGEAGNGEAENDQSGAVTGAMLARNPWNGEYQGRVAFADLGGRQRAWTADRGEFLGRNGTLARPAALVGGRPLSGRVGAGLDPCGALQAPVEIPPHGTAELVFVLGEAASGEEARSLVATFRAADLDHELARVVAHWDTVLGRVVVRTPDRALDIMLNRWLLYQTIVCRVWARAAFYQASGAYGFRDQLQDTMALAAILPDETRAHLLRAAGRQFAEGDVQHWWLPTGRTAGQGVRTRFSDDRLWLVHAATHYVTVSGDGAVLDEEIPFLEGPRLNVGESESFFAPAVSERGAPLFEHCALALDGALDVGAHGLPLIGSGDWNDGMNRVGIEGRGESVWLGWFLLAAIDGFAPLAEARGATGRAAVWRERAAALKLALEDHGWDGAWYRRGYYDDGTPLGSESSQECRIDQIAQSWAVISGGADPGRAAQAMASVEYYLLRPEDGLALLFTPPFDRTSQDPGYIKGYPPGLRENGGQYTHAALWSVIALARLGEGDKAAALLAMLNPIHHASTRLATHRYKVEPYVVAADVYANPLHIGRGGWTWYTGSSAWMHRAGVESILGLRVRGAGLSLDPCLPTSWPKVEIAYRYRSARYDIVIENPERCGRGVVGVEVDGEHRLPDSVTGGAAIPLLDDGAVHRVRVILGRSPPPDAGMAV